MNKHVPRLSVGTLERLTHARKMGVELPPAGILNAPEIVLQIGFGKFVRGFMADFLQRAFAAGHFRGRMLAVQRKPDQRVQNLRDQDGLYTLITRGRIKDHPSEAKQIVGSVARAVDAKTAWPEVMMAAERRELKIISTNVSEGGLTADDSDRLEAQPPSGFAGKLCQLLYHRWRTLYGQEAEIAIVPCELVKNNGDLVRCLITEQAQRWKLEQPFLSWLRTSLHVANTVVDRIVVGAPAGDLQREWDALGYRDDLLNCAEPFYEFVLQGDDFIQRNLPLDQACSNLRYVQDLEPYRTRKVLILNGPHTTLAAVGWLLGIRTVLDAMHERDLGMLIEAIMLREVIPALSLPDYMDLPSYAREVLDRFRNPWVQHELRAICLNSSVKVGTRIFPTVRRHMDRFGQVPRGLTLGIAAVLLTLRDPELQDTNAAYIRERWQMVNPTRSESLHDFASDVLTRQMEWSRETIELEPVSIAVAHALSEIQSMGARSVIAERLAHTTGKNCIAAQWK